MRPVFCKLLLGALLIFFIASTCEASGLCGDVDGIQTDPKTAEPISDEDFLDLIKNSKCVLHRRIQATAILRALRWIQESARQNQPLPKIGIWVQYSTVEGLSQFTPTEKNENAPVATPVGELPTEISNIYKKIGVESVIEVPVRLAFVSTVFTDEFSSGFGFENFLFEEDAFFNEVTFKTEVSFNNTVFSKKANFHKTTFESVAHFDHALFKGMADFGEASFQEWAVFRQSTFRQGIDLHEATFQRWVRFNETEFGGASTFDGATFQSQVYFAKAALRDDTSFGGVSFSGTTFKEDAFFTDLNGNAEANEGVLKFYGTDFQGRTYFTNSRLRNLLFFPGQWMEGQSKGYQALKEAISPVSFGKRAVFHGLRCDAADFSSAEFRDHADFSNAQFADYADFSNASFAASADFFQTDFPPKTRAGRTLRDGAITGLVVDNTEIQKPINLKWEQIKDKVNTQASATWRRLEEVFKQEDELEGQNESKYQERYLEGSKKEGWSWLSNRIQFWFWGYGVRPWWLACLILFVFSIFTGIYFTQTKSLASGRSTLGGWVERVKSAATFSALNSIYLNYGYQRSCTTTFKAVTLIQALGFKVLFFFLLKSFANVIPVLNELVGKLIPF